MNAAVPELCYEDYVAPEGGNVEFPLVGTWLTVHYVVQLLSYEGVRLLEFLGLRSENCLALRVALAYFRQAVASAAADLLRLGPLAVAFHGPQWVLTVEHYLLTGEVLGLVRNSVEVPSSSSGPVFPYVCWGSPNVVHYLWRVLASQGHLVLSMLGERAREWAFVRAVSRDFFSNMILAIILWLQATGTRRQADGAVAFQAAFAYLQTGEREYPFLESEDETLDDHPHTAPRPQEVVVQRFAYAIDDPSSEESSSSTEEPSIVDASTESSSAEVVEAEPALSDTVPTELLSLGQGLVYQAAEGALEVHYVDDVLRVPLEGWSLEEVAVVVQCLQTGDWTEFSEGLCAASVGHGMPGSSNDPPGHAHIAGRLLRGFRSGLEGLRGFLWSLIVMWFLVQSVRGYEIGDSSSVEGDFPLVWCGNDPSSCSPTGPQEVALLKGLGSNRCDGSTLWALAKAVCLIGIWEAVRWIVSNWRTLQHGRVEVASQTQDFNVIQLPLPKGVPHRDRILFSLWIAGYQVDAEACEYSDRVRSGFHGLIGDYLCRLERDGLGFSDEDSLSETPESEHIDR
ncbi:unnamed protein product [Symbiodinium sp. CCMP2592]|nr:unnamed protein product [Symbiodinium sp. CCMP2592]